MGKSLKVRGTSKSTAAVSSSYNPLITKAVQKAVKKTVAAIDKVLAGEKKASVNLGGLLAKLKSEIATHLVSAGVTSEYQTKVAFHNFVQVRFKIGESRVSEYIKLSEREDIHKLGLPTSVLIELTRLETKALKTFMTKYPTAALKKLPFKEIRKLVRDSNKKKRTTTSKGAKKEKSPIGLADKLKNTFEIVKDKFDSEPTLDKGLDSVLGQISKWYLDKKVA